MTVSTVLDARDGTLHGHLEGPAGRLSFAEAMAALRRADVRRGLTATLAGAPFPAFFWECAPTTADLDAPFAFVLVDSPALARVSADPRPFARHLVQGGDAVRTFANLGGQSLLIAPDDIGPSGAHLARFVREGPPSLVDALWRAIPPAVERWFGEDRGPLWLSTSGLGVSWLHLRLDPRPKYYTWQPFRRPPAGGLR